MQKSCVNTKQLAFFIRNNTDATIPISVLQNAYNNGFLNSTTKYQYDISSQDYSNVDSVSIQVKTQGTDNYITYTAPMTSKDAAGVVAGLNTLGVGTFYINEDSGQIYIITDNDNYVYGDLDIFNGHPVTTFWIPSIAYAASGIGPTIFNYASFVKYTDAPSDIQKYTTAYLWLAVVGGGPIVWGSNTVPYSSAPNWTAFPGNVANALVAWLTGIFTAITGAVPADYVDVFNGDDTTYAIAKVPVGTWPGGNVGKPSLEADGTYNFGLLNLTTNTIYVLGMKFSKTE